jgi:Uma2 family endonuclease
MNAPPSAFGRGVERLSASGTTLSPVVYTGGVKKVGAPARRMDRHYTYRDYRDWPEDERWELIDGVAYDMSPAPSVNHQRLVTGLGSQISRQLRGGSCEALVAPVDVFLPADPTADEDDVDTVVQPDVVVVCDRFRIRANGIWGPPDLVVEIISPWTAKKDLAEKFNAYERAGVREYWVVDPGNRSVVVYVQETEAGGAAARPRGSAPRYGTGRVHAALGKIACTAVEGVEVDFAEAFAPLSM